MWLSVFDLSLHSTLEPMYGCSRITCKVVESDRRIRSESIKMCDECERDMKR